jgi:two-component system, NarL family, nitrate/nitrite response regulator NarL
MTGRMTAVLVVTDVRFYREGLAELLSRSPDIAIAGTAAGDDACERLRECGADIVLLDTRVANGFETTRRIAADAPDVKVVALALQETDDDIIAWAEAGVAAYVPRDASIAELIAAVERTARGELLCPPRIAASLLRRLGRVRPVAAAVAPAAAEEALTQRERELLPLIEQGLSNKEIARRLGIQLATVKSHVHNILEKLHLHRRIQIATLHRKM